MQIKLIFMVAVLFLFAIFIVQNAQVVMVSFLFWQIEASRAIVLMVTFISGLVTGWVMTKVFSKKKPVADRMKDKSD